MNSIIQQITDWLKGLLVSGIMNNLTNTFSSVNDQVGQIATEVGQTPSSFLPAVFNMVRNLSETVIMPIAGILLTFIACYELIQLIISYAEVLMHPALEEIGTCPCCGRHGVEKQKGYFCEDRGCSFVLWKQNRFFEALGK